MASASTSLRQKALLVGIGFLLAALLGEGALRSAAWLMRVRAPTDATRTIHPAEDSYRVLALGESTTASFFGVAPYTHYLEGALNRHSGTRFQIVNVGTPGAHSSHLLERLPGLLDEHDPHMVIAMMGINDYMYFDGVDAAVPPSIQGAVVRSRFLRLLLIAKELLVSGFRQTPADEIDREHLRRFRAALDQSAELQDPAELERMLQRALGEAREAAQASAGPDRIWSLPPPYRPIYRILHNRLAQLYLVSGRGQSAVALWREATERDPNAEYFHRGLAELYEDLGDEESAELYGQRADALARSHVLRITRDNYRKLVLLLRERDVELVVMQYPLRSVEGLQLLFDDPSDVAFVDNEPAFRTAVAAHGFEKVFRDRFAGDFGHCTMRGNRIIARNVLDQIFVPRFAHLRRN